jgi:HAD superfamily hydrolase (TIGR01509 family)
VRATVLLDLYGTLVEPDWPALLKGRTSLAEQMGLDASAAQHAWDTTHAARMAGGYGSLADDLAAIFSEAANGSGPAISPLLLSELADQERENWRRGVHLYPDSLPGLSRLRASGLRLAMVTNSSAEAASVVDALGLRHLVDDVFASCEVGVLKPHLLGVALRTLGVEASDATLVDDEPGELDGAARLGIGTILVRRSAPRAPEASTPGARAVTDLQQVADLVVRAERGRRR